MDKWEAFLGKWEKPKLPISKFPFKLNSLLLQTNKTKTNQPTSYHLCEQMLCSLLEAAG